MPRLGSRPSPGEDAAGAVRVRLRPSGGRADGGERSATVKPGANAGGASRLALTVALDRSQAPALARMQPGAVRCARGQAEGRADGGERSATVKPGPTPGKHPALPSPSPWIAAKPRPWRGCSRGPFGIRAAKRRARRRRRAVGNGEAGADAGGASRHAVTVALDCGHVPALAEG